MYAFVGDLHLGVKLPNEDYMKSLNMFFGLIKKYKEPCHGIFIVGDLFDHRLTIEENKFAALFIANLVCNGVGRDGSNVPVYFIHGTYSHDLDQYETFIPLIQKIPNTKVFYYKNACETVIDGHDVLIIPHESGDVDYTQFKKHYDIIAGHGVISSQIYNPCKTTNGICLSAESLGNTSYVCVFGHYHGYTNFGNKVYYTGPWLRWKYGEDEQRVFFFCNDDYTITTKKNPFAMEFKTIEIENPEQLRDAINCNITTPHRFIIKSDPSDMDTYRGIILATKQNSNIRYQLSEIVEEDEYENNDVDNDEQSDDGSSVSRPIPALVEYIKEKYNVDATEQLTEYENVINKDMKEN